ncbi:hypothetical protein LCGC14_2072670 [marine sediment metagenome]|uniref:DUF669 domain-containing protein n=1 Tax=marine sediment metagenome TaxID=412755 RepID=A0A0F9EI45_9ZZZZ
MVKVNMNKIEDAEDFSPIPDGAYLCKIVEVDDTKETQNGDPMWRIRWEVLEGDYAGRIIFDNLIFSAKALKRVKLVFSRLGLDVSKDEEAEWTPQMIQDKHARITVLTEEYESEKGPRKRNSVPFNGIEAVESTAAGGGEVVPF